MSNLEIFSVIISLIGVGLTILRNMWCWPFNMLAYILYGYLFFTYQLYGEVILQIFFSVMNLYGFYVWMKGKQVDHDIKIEPLAFSKIILQLIVSAIAGLAFGLILKNFTNAAVPMLDAQLAAFSLLATYWTSRKHIATWVLWVVVDIIYVGMFIYKDLYLTAGLYAAFVVMAVYGWYQWLRVQSQQRTELMSTEN
ncbi:nicotinamide riboside transporter PnuC [Acinetobacter sp. ANC 4636]|uniref:nicotinamide riboside transporter PnuC n=1 Tax=Acinetobacter sp. ANC 4635 TaxID=2529846 RepID=UPI00103D3BC6|nr:nicotinamide riboside transporter PnuC [Acinetobacter sp. ANC 4635]TCB32722.1 nicotinamide riboside transporter PnuC [Acinetobacter sp. ANC 4635]